MKEKYLKEDEDLINQLKEIGTFGTDHEEKQRQVQEIHILATLRHRKSFEDAEKSNTKISNTLIIFAIVQILIAFYQLMISVLDSSSKITGAILIIFVLIFIYKINKLVD